MKLHTFFDFCSGIGGGRLGLEMAGMKSVGYSETSKLSATTYQMMFDTRDEKNFGDLRKIDTSCMPNYDVLIAGFPCQSFSVIGRQEGFQDIRGQIIFYLAQILKETQPKCFILENVKGLVTHNNGETLKTILHLLESVGYHVQYWVLNSLEYGVPQMRYRIYFVGVRRDLCDSINRLAYPSTSPIPSFDKYLVDHRPINEEELKYFIVYLKNKTNQGKYSYEDILAMEGKIIDTRMSDLRIYTGKCPTLRSQRDGLYYIKNGSMYALTGHEALLLQGIPAEFADKVKDKVWDRHLLMQAGNAMTVNVIKAIGKSLTDFFENIEETDINYDINMAEVDWIDFEDKCADYLNRRYSETGCTFKRVGGSDSKSEDIMVFKNGKHIFSMEVKKPIAQCGQFVLFPNEITKRFDFSARNKSEITKQTEDIINDMNLHFEEYKTPSAKNLPISSKLCSAWIKEYYNVQKHTDFFITAYHSEVTIFPVNRFEEYFDVTVKYRTKPSGSGNPPASHIPEIKSTLKANGYCFSDFRFEGKYLIVTLTNATADVLKLSGSRFVYQFKKQAGPSYKITYLGKTRNANIIFSIKSKCPQKAEDLALFEAALSQ